MAPSYRDGKHASTHAWRAFYNQFKEVSVLDAVKRFPMMSKGEVTQQVTAELKDLWQSMDDQQREPYYQQAGVAMPPPSKRQRRSKPEDMGEVAHDADEEDNSGRTTKSYSRLTRWAGNFMARRSELREAICKGGG
eukprot:6912456-Karenia_brevis.AAC.1